MVLDSNSRGISRRHFVAGALAATGALVASMGSVTFAAASTGTPSVSANLLLNGSFELANGNGIPNNWVAKNFVSGDGQTSNQFEDGSYSLMMIGQYTGFAQPSVHQKVVVTAPAGELFTLTAWNLSTYNATGLNDIILMLKYSDGTHQSKKANFPIRQTSWQQTTINLTAAKPVTSAVVTIKYAVYDETSYFDNVSLTMSP